MSPLKKWKKTSTRVEGVRHKVGVNHPGRVTHTHQKHTDGSTASLIATVPSAILL